MLAWEQNLGFAASASASAAQAPASHGTFLMTGNGMGCWLMPLLVALFALGVR